MKFLRKPVLVKRSEGAAAVSDIRGKKGLPPKTNRNATGTAGKEDAKVKR